MFHNRRMPQLLTLAILLASLPLAATAEVSFVRQANRIEVSMDGKPFTTFFFGPEATKPYLHPLRTADGIIVTRSYPMEEVPGEQTDHPHHRGVWFSHGDVNGVDFWANEITQRHRGKKGVIALDSIHKVGAGTGQDSIEASFAWNAPSGETLLTERRAMRFGRVGEDNIVDFDITLTAKAETVRFGDTKEGTFGVRMATELEEPHWRAKGIQRTGMIENAEGLTREANAWGKRSAWVDYAGTLGGAPMGIAIFDHPGNPKHPSYWHVRGYGLFAANIFGEHDFHADESRDGSITLARGESLRFRYRVVVHEGRTGEANLARKYREWAGLEAGRSGKGRDASR